ncbi:MAG: hypothetical protein ACRES3_07915 [Steroidobacteraceae bacterium]
MKSRSYFIVEGKPKLVSEGAWFWHPGEKQIKGVFTAIDMPVVFFDYTTRFEANKMMVEAIEENARGHARGDGWHILEEVKPLSSSGTSGPTTGCSGWSAARPAAEPERQVSY